MERDDVLLQEFYADDPWKLLVSCILLNQTGRTQVNAVIDHVFERWPTSSHMAVARQSHLVNVIRPLGLHNVRAKRLIDFSNAWRAREFVSNTSPEPAEVAEMPGIGDYALDSYRIFHLEDRSACVSGDKELLAWAERKGVVFA